MGFTFSAQSLINVLAATLPGVLVALVAFLLTQRGQNQDRLRLQANARRLLALETGANAATLRAFWEKINQLDAEHSADVEIHLRGMAAGDLLSYDMPVMRATRWDHFALEAGSAFSGPEIERLDTFYRQLTEITDLYAKIVTLTPEETQITTGNRFWFNQFANWRVTLFQRLTADVERFLKSPEPLARR